jgi:hypothetical protein
LWPRTSPEPNQNGGGLLDSISAILLRPRWGGFAACGSESLSVPLGRLPRD